MSFNPETEMARVSMPGLPVRVTKAEGVLTHKHPITGKPLGDEVGLPLCVLLAGEPKPASIRGLEAGLIREMIIPLNAGGWNSSLQQTFSSKLIKPILCST